MLRKVQPFKDIKDKKSDLYQSKIEMVHIMNYKYKKPLILLQIDMR